jgi:pimeloyl-ACP methyl ester carboxylesterase
MVAIAAGVSLEVLDWGGTGRPLVLLAGLHNTAHVFDDLALSFTDSFHVYAITRRGFGRSSQPPDSDAATLVSDLRIVVDSLRLSKVILLGHSIAGEELTGFAVSYPNRCEALIYLDAAYDRSGTSALKALAKMPWPARPPMTSADSASVAAVKAYYERTDGVRMLEGDARAVFRFDSAGRFVFEDSLAKRMIGRLVGHLTPPPYQRLTCPSLAIYAVPDSPGAAVPWYTLLDSAGRAQADRLFPFLQAWNSASRRQYRQNAPLAHIVEIHNAHHYVFESNRAETLQAIRAFIAELPSPRREHSSGAR